MFDTQALQAHFSRAAQYYDERAILQRTILEDALQVIAPHWKEGAHIADIGSGTGWLAAASAACGWQITGCDIAYGMCRYASGQGYRAVNGDAHLLPFADGSFDGACSSLMLQWANDPQRVFKEMERILRLGSYSIITTFSKGSLQELQHAFKAIDSRLHTTPFRAMEEWAMDASQAGFSVKRLHERTMMEYYPDTLRLMHAIKGIGAGNKLSGGIRRSLSRRQLNVLEEAYQNAYATPEGLPLTWKVLTLLLYKK